MVDSEYSTGHYKPSNVSIKRKKKKKTEMLKFVSDDLENKMMRNYAVVNLPLVTTYGSY